MTGYLVPHPEGDFIDVAPAEQAEIELEAQEGQESLGPVPESDSTDGESDAQSARRTFKPSSLGLSFLIPEETSEIDVELSWGDYRAQPPIAEALIDPEADDEARLAAKQPDRDTLSWHRTPHVETLTLQVGAETDGKPVPSSMVRGGALMIVPKWGRVREMERPGETSIKVRHVSVFVVNRRPSVARRFEDLVNAHQVRLEVRSTDGFAPMIDLTGYRSDDPDDRLSDLHYRDVTSFGAGHNASIGWSDAPVTAIWTDPLPNYEVPLTRADVGQDLVELKMETLAEAADDDADALRAALGALPQAYADWAAGQSAGVDSLPPRRKETAERCLAGMEEAQNRLKEGLQRLTGDATAREAFAVMNRAVAAANRQRTAQAVGIRPEDVKPPQWRLFQIAFILLNMEGLADPLHDDRAVVDLLFFPTGGGKTEAYLGLAAFAIAQRRLRNPGLQGAGLSVLMRYTLRLLTLDQLARAAGVVCALELERKRDGKLGDWPIEIGLWVGGAATPNRFGKEKDIAETTLRFWLREMSRKGPAPLPLSDCPWCGTKLSRRESFKPYPNATAPRRLDVCCDDLDCDFHGTRLPIVTVDEDVYRRLPAFMIATVDKFASMPWEGRTGSFFGNVERYDAEGFYGPAERGIGRRLDEPLPPMDLVIQDELHLISGPLGTVAGLYEVAFDLLASRIVNGRRIGPKIVASTATVRRADEQVRSLFGREKTAIFPPPGVSRHNSFFARTDDESRGRLYLGIGAPGDGPRRVFLRSLQTLLSGSFALSSKENSDPADPYLTALCYFNALRELGGARRIVEDEIRRNLSHYGRSRQRQRPKGAPFSDRDLREPLELTSRVSTSKVAEARAVLGTSCTNEDGADVAMATNMISVGLDIPRLGLMVLQGQPKTTSEYIQATSRVGREKEKPGLVIALLNLHRPRDRSHYERFCAFHASFYRTVEPTGITPFATRALDRGLAAVVVAAARHLEPEMARSERAQDIALHPHLQDQIKKILHDRMKVGNEEAGLIRVTDRLDELLFAWTRIADVQADDGLRYEGKDDNRRLLRDALKRLGMDGQPERDWFVAGRSMRETEPVALLEIVEPSGKPFETKTKGAIK